MKLTEETGAVNFAFPLGEEVISVSSTSSVFEGMTASVFLVEKPAVNKVFAWSRLLKTS